MPNLLKNLESGAVLEVTMAPFEDAEALLEAVMQETESIQINLGADFGSFEDFLAQGGIKTELINTVKNAVCRILGSRKVKDAIWICMKRATYNGLKITRETFEPEQSRADYITIAKEVLWFNLSPFFKSLALKFSEKLRKAPNAPKSE